MNADNIGLRDGKILGKATGAVYANPLGIGAKMEHAATAITAMTAHNMPFAGNHLAGLKLGNGRAHSLNNTAKLMPHMHTYGDGLLSPGIPIPNMQIRAANGCAINLNENIIGADLGHRHLHQFETFIGLCFDERFHGRRYYSSTPELASLILIFCLFFVAYNRQIRHNTHIFGHKHGKNTLLTHLALYASMRA